MKDESHLCLFDIQVNGFAGIDFNDENIDAEMLDSALEAMLKTGVTCCLPTLITASKAVLMKRFQALDKAVANSELGALMVPGYHLEGPFLNPADGYAGCHPAEDMTPPDPSSLLTSNTAFQDRFCWSPAPLNLMKEGNLCEG